MKYRFVDWTLKINKPDIIVWKMMILNSYWHTGEKCRILLTLGHWQSTKAVINRKRLDVSNKKEV